MKNMKWEWGLAGNEAEELKGQEQSGFFEKGGAVNPLLTMQLG